MEWVSLGQVTFNRLSEDDLWCIGANLVGPADRLSLARSCRSCHAALATAVMSDRQTAIRSVHDRHCSCLTPGSCVWLSKLHGRHVQLKHVPSVLIGDDHPAVKEAEMRVLLSLLRRPCGVHQTLDELVLDYSSGIEPAAVKLLRSSLPCIAPALQSLSMAGCRLCDAGVSSIAEMVNTGGLRRLNSIAVEDNPFSPAARSRLRLACRKHGIALSAFTEIENESIY